MKKRIIDKRKKQKFMLDDEYLNGQAKLCGWKGTIVYNSLCRHANKEQQCFPSIKLMAEQHGVGKDTIIKGLKKLEQNNLIKIEKTRNKNGAWLNNTYILIDKSEWIYPSQVDDSDLVNGLSKSTTATWPSRRQRPGQVDDSDTKETHIKETHIKDSSKTSFCGKDVNYVISLFEEVNVLSDSLFGNKTERSAVEFLLERVPLQKLEGVVKALPITNTYQFAPKITKPTELKRDISKLVAFINSNKIKFNKTNRKA